MANVFSEFLLLEDKMGMRQSILSDNGIGFLLRAIKMAEGEGFEPPVMQAPRRFSKPQL
jgi:hypothetical protein